MSERAISIQQPWAWLIVNGYKDVENRDWPTRIRGMIAIHAGKKFDHDGAAWARRKFPHITIPPLYTPGSLVPNYDLGGIVGWANLTDCVERSDSPWFTGRYGFVLANAKPAPFVPCRGQLGFFVPQFAEWALPRGATTPREGV